MMSAPALISGWALISGSAAFDFGVGTLRPPGPCPQSASAHRRPLTREMFFMLSRHCTWSANQLAYQLAFRYADFNGAAAIAVDLLMIGLVGAVLIVTRSGLFRTDD